ncbi:MAG: hypothetical protein K6F84_08430 [Lachnospiraceae bacterium]|nr:hypothetical protein [Lachnospiraceae bacterium]
MKHTHMKKNKFLTFGCSLLPGAAEMYMGFLNNGLSLLLVFMAAVLLCWGFGEVFCLALFIVWVYGFFHAWSIRSLDEESFKTSEDVYIWEEFTNGRDVVFDKKKVEKTIPVILLLMGFGILWNSFSYLILDFIPDNLWHIFSPIITHLPGNVFAVICVVLGFKLLRNKKKDMDKECEELKDGCESQSK